MAGKSTATRLTQTVTHIQNNGALNANHRTRAVAYLNQYIVGHPAQATAISNAMHIGDSSADPHSHRPARRSYVLLHAVITAAFPDVVLALTGLGNGLIGTVGPTAVNYLPELVRIAAVLRDAQTNTDFMSNEALHALQAGPLVFLQTKKVMVLGSTARDAAQGDRNRLAFYFRYNVVKGRYEFDIISYPGRLLVNVDSVTARWWTDIPGSYVNGGNIAHGNFSQLAGIELGEPIMVTTQFTGCAFAMERVNGHVYCAHTTPRPPMANFNNVVRPMTGNQLAQDIHDLNGVAGIFANVHGSNNLTIYGAGWEHGTLHGQGYPNGLHGGAYMTLLGFQQAHDYHIYSQVTQGAIIGSAQRIF